LSTADFGKVMKQVYPQVRPRRLGTRGNSRYCYAGLKKRVRLEMPMTPDIGSEGRKTESADSEEELNSAASFLIREWVEKLLGVKFETLTDLAFHLLEKMYVDNRSVAAFTFLSSGSKFNSNPPGGIKPNLTSPGLPEVKPRDQQLQAQRKLQETKLEPIKLDQLDSGLQHRPLIDQKRKLPEHQQNHNGGTMLIGKRSKLGSEDDVYSMETGGLDFDGGVSESSKCDIQQRYSVVVPNSQSSDSNSGAHYVLNGGSVQDSQLFENGGQPQDFTNYSRGPEVVDRLELVASPLAMGSGCLVTGQHRPSSAISIEHRPSSAISIDHRPPSSISIDKLPRKKQALVEAASLAAAQGMVCLDNSQVRCLDPGQVRCLDHETGHQVILAAHGGHTSVIKAGEKPKNKYKEVQQEDESWADPKVNSLEVKGEWDAGVVDGLQYDEPADLTTLGRGTTNTWEKGVLGGSGGSSSDAQEEELVRYFSQSEIETGGAEDNKSEKLSQLRQLLEKNLKSPTNLSVSGGGAFKRTGGPCLQSGGKTEVVSSSSGGSGYLQPNDVTPGLNSSALNLNTTNLSTRRRVSFNPLIVSDPASTVSPSVTTSNCPVPPSPGSRRRHFSFQPISPRQSMPQSPPASPFISPRSTPVHMLRSRHSSGSALPLHLLPGTTGGNSNNGRQQHPSGSSDVSRAATFGSASESSTPFISPQSTPIPFNRSRHNSAQGRLCRSRHSSGVPLTGGPAGGYRYQTMPYSPMALNNLNNPFSPQPSTPIICQDIPGGLSDGGPQFPNPPQSGLFVSPGGTEDPRSRHSSAGSDTAPRSAPLSPYNPGVVSGGRQRHQSAGQLPAATATIHYRPSSWQSTNGDQQSTIQPNDFNTEVSSLLPEISERSSYGYSQSQPATPGSGGGGGGFTYQGGGVINNNIQPNPHSQHSSYNNTPVPPEFGVEGDLELGTIVGEAEEKLGATGQKKKDNDDLDLALDALRDCDTDFNKFVQEVGATVNN